MPADQTNSLKLQLAKIRTRAIARLVTMSSMPADEYSETFLFENDRFCGVRWTLGEAKAVWRSGSDEIAYEQNGKPIAEAASQQSPPLRRAA